MFLVYFSFRSSNCSIFQQLRKINLNMTSYTNISDILFFPIELSPRACTGSEISLPHFSTVLEASFLDPHLVVFSWLVFSSFLRKDPGRWTFGVLACSLMSSFSHLNVSLIGTTTESQVKNHFSTELEGIARVFPIFQIQCHRLSQFTAFALFLVFS